MQRSTLITLAASCAVLSILSSADAEDGPTRDATPRSESLPTPSLAAPSGETIDDVSERYFDAEDLCNGVYVGLGATLTVGGAVAIGASGDRATSTAGYPLVVVGGIEIALGILYLGLTPGFREEAVRSRVRGERVLLRDQTERMREIESNFVYYKVATGAVVVVGVALSAIGAAADEDALRGVGFGLATAASAELGMQHVTHGVARDYLRSLEAFVVSPVVVPTLGAGMSEQAYVGLRAATAF